MNVATGGFGTEITAQTDEGLKNKLGGAAYFLTGPFCFCLLRFSIGDEKRCQKAFYSYAVPYLLTGNFNYGSRPDIIVVIFTCERPNAIFCSPVKRNNSSNTVLP